MKNVIKINIYALILFCFFEVKALAYIGPAIAMGSLAIIILLVISVLFALITISYLPLKKIYLKIKNKNEKDKSS